MEHYSELCVGFPKEYELLKENAHRFAKEVLRPAAIEVDRMNDPRDVIRWIRRCARLSRLPTLLATTLPRSRKSWAGRGFAGWGMHVLIEELAWGSADLRSAFWWRGFLFRRP